MHSELLAQPRLRSRPAIRRDRILVVDDDPALVEILCRRLENQGYQTITAESGESGVEIARRESPSLIVLDLRLPDTDGFSVCERLADDPQTCHVPVIILSGMERPDIIRRSRKAGCQYFVRKPYDPNALLLLIKSAIAEADSWQRSEMSY